nr:hypothetical protein [uncultured Methanobrevibacter sp.]
MGFFYDEFTKKMSIQSIIFALILFIISICIRCYNLSFFGVDSFYFSLILSVMAGLQLIIGFDYYANGASERPFGLGILYLSGLVLGAIIFYLVILNIPVDAITQIIAFLKIEAVR